MVFGEAKKRPTIGRRIKESKRDEQKLYNLVRRAQGPVGRQVPVFSGGAANVETGASGGAFLKTAGDTMMGPIAFFPALVTISAGAIDIGKTTDNFSSRVIVTPQSGSTDDLDTISNAEHNGQLLFLQGVQTDTITLTNSGNIETIDGNDFKIVDDDIIILQFDVTDNKWQQVTIGKQSSGGVSFPITPTIDDHGNVGTVTEDIVLNATDSHIHKLTLTGNPTLTFSNPPASGTQVEFEIEYVQDATGGRTVTQPGSVSETVNISAGASSTTIITYRTNDGGTVYHAIPALRGSISLSAPFLPLVGGTLTGNLLMSGANIDLNNNNIIDINDLLFNETGQSIISDTGGLNISVDTGQTIEWFEAGVPSMTLNASQNLDLEGHNLLGVNTLTVAALAAFNGDVSLGNTTADTITVPGLIGSDILSDVTGRNIGGTGNEFISLFLSGSVLLNNTSTTLMTGNADGIELRVPSGDGIEFMVNGDVTPTVLINSSGNFDFNGNSILDLNDIAFNVAGQTIIADTNGLHLSSTNPDFIDFTPSTTLVVTMDDFFLRLRNTSTTQDPQFVLHMNDSTPANDATIGRMFFEGEDSASNQQQYVAFVAKSALTTSGSEEGNIDFQVATGTSGALSSALELEGGTTGASSVKIAFRGATVQSVQTYSRVTTTTDRAVSDTSTIATEELGNILGTLLDDLSDMGIITGVT